MSTQLATIDTLPNGLVWDGGGSTEDYGTDAGNTAWLKFFGNKSKVAEKVKPAGVKLNEFYYEDALGIIALDPCRVFAFHVLPHRVILDGGGRVDVAAPYDKEPAEGDTRRWCERVLVALLVSHPAGLQPALYAGVKAMCRPWEKAVGVAQGMRKNMPSREAEAEAVGKRGPLWEPASRAVSTYGRFVLKLWGKQVPPKNNPKGEPYNAAFCEILPPTEAEVLGFNAFSHSESHQQLSAAFAHQVSQIQEKFE